MEATIEKLTTEMRVLGKTLAIGKNNQKAIALMLEQGRVKIGGTFQGYPWFELVNKEPVQRKPIKIGC